MLIIKTAEDRERCTSCYGNIIVELTMEEVVALFSGATLGDPNFNEYGIFIRLEGSTQAITHEKEHSTMTINEYQALALRTESRITTDPVPYIRVLEGLMGLNGEAGEAIDLMKKVLFQGHEFDREHMAKELGDIAWYLAVSADAIGYDLESILQMNVDKLRTRYPDGFSTEQSLHRSANDI